MNKKLSFLLALILAVLICSGALAVQKLGNYSLVVAHEPMKLTSSTGYVYKNGSVLMIPVKSVCESLDYECESRASGKGVMIKRPDGVEVILRAGSSQISVGSARKPLRTKTLLQPGGIVTCDVRAVRYLQAGFKNYYASIAKPAGYPAGALVVSDDGDLSLPTVTAPTDNLPAELRPAAKLTDQIVGVEYKSGSAAKLTLYEKVNNTWIEQYSALAAVGVNGIGKTAEGDGKTPSGTFDLTKPFGILANPGCKMSGYVKVTKYHYWCSNPQSKYYNRMIDIRDVDYTPTDKDEKLINIKPYYNYALFINYNANCVPGLGSAIFLHCKGANASTSGCVAIPQQVMKSLMLTLNTGVKIVIY